MIYLCQPYSHSDPQVMQSRFVFGAGAAAALFSTGVDVYSPIVHWHWIAEHFDLPTDAAHWRAHNLHVVEQCEAVYCLLLLGWQHSVGMRGEVEHAVLKGLPLFTVNLLAFPHDPALNKFSIPTLRTAPVQDTFSFRRYFNAQDHSQSGLDA